MSLRSEDLAFSVDRMHLGMVGELADGAKARAVFEILDGVNGPTPGIFDLWMEAEIHPRVSVRTGVQATVFGSRDFFPFPATGMYLVGPTFKSTIRAAGMINKRDLGVRARVDSGDSRGIDLMLTEDRGIMRVTQELGGDLSLSASGQQGTRDESDGLYAWSGLVRVDKPNLRGLLEVFGGSPGVDQAAFMGGEGALLVGCDLSMGALERAAVVLRHGAFHPQGETETEDGWSLTNAAVQLHWPSHPGTDIMTGLGVQVRTEAGERSDPEAMAQVLWVW